MARESGLAERPTQTHTVFIGKFKIPAYQDGDVIRCLQTGEVVAKRTKKGWSETIKAVTPWKPGRYDHIRPLNRDAVVVHLDKGEFY